jgi:hypothetical protein
MKRKKDQSILKREGETITERKKVWVYKRRLNRGGSGDKEKEKTTSISWAIKVNINKKNSQTF